MNRFQKILADGKRAGVDVVGGQLEAILHPFRQLDLTCTQNNGWRIERPL